ncbi:TPA: flagellar filament capping protein FliD [Photobacterium damselae]
MGLSAAGMSSGLDISGMTQQLVAAERAPKEERIKKQQTQINVSLSAYSQVTASVKGMQDMFKDFAKDDAFSSQKASSNKEDYIGVKATSKAKNGTYSVNVLQMAQSHKLVSQGVFSADPKTSLGSGPLTIKVGEKEMTLDIGEDNDDLNSIIDAINNAEDNPGITATLINTGDENGSKIVFSTKETGAENTISIDASKMSGQLADLNYDPADTTSSKMDEMQKAQDAKIQIDGFTTITNSTNKFEGVIEGVTLDIKQLTGTTGSGKPETDDIDVKKVEIKIENDDKTSKDSMKKFVDSYNSFVKMIDSLSKYDLEAKKGGALVGDSLTRSLSSQMRNLLNEPIDVNGKMVKLSDFGLETQRDGSIELDDDKLDEAIEKNFNVLGQFFNQEDTGFLDKADKLLDTFTDKVDGSLTVKENTLKKQQEGLNDDLEDLNTQMKAYEDRTYKQFVAMDEAIGQMNNQLNSMMSLMVSFDS